MLAFTILFKLLITVFFFITYISPHPSSILAPIFPQLICQLTLFSSDSNFLILIFFFFSRRLLDFKQSIVGQSLPFEDFAIHKANKYFEQNDRLFLAGVVGPIVYVVLLTLYSVTPVYIFSTLFSMYFLEC